MNVSNKLRGIEFPKPDMNVTRKPTRDHFKSFKKNCPASIRQDLAADTHIAVPLLRQHAPLPQGVT